MMPYRIISQYCSLIVIIILFLVVPVSGEMNIDSFTPETGTNNGIVTITMSGTGFQSDSISNIWLNCSGFDRIFCSSYQVTSDTQVSAQFDLTGQSPGSYLIVIGTISSVKYQSKSPFKVYYPSPPMIYEIIPDYGLINDQPYHCTVQGDDYMISSTVQFVNSSGVIFPAITSYINWNTLSCTFSVGQEKGDRYLVQVINPDTQVSTEQEFFTVRDLPPVVTTVTPDAGVNVDTSCELTVGGLSFHDGCTLTLYDSLSGATAMNLSPTVVSADGLNVSGLFDLSGLPIGEYQVIVENPDGQKSIDEVFFTVRTPAPVVVSVIPTSGVLNDSNLELNVSGSYFQVNCLVHLCDSLSGTMTTNLSQTVVSAGGLNVSGLFDLSGLPVGEYEVIVENPDGSISSDKAVFLITPPPEMIFEINIVAGYGGLTSPSGSVKVSESSDLNVVVLPDNGFCIQNVYIDHTPQGSLPSILLSDIHSNHEIFVDFSMIAPPTPPLTFPPTPTPFPTSPPVPEKYCINVSSDIGCLIHPNGTINVPAQSDLEFSMESLPGFHLVHLMVDTVPIDVSNSWVLHSIHSNHDLKLISERNISPHWADFNMSLVSNIQPYLVSFNSQQFSDALWEFWDFGDGSVTYGTSIQHSYRLAGNYSIAHQVVFNNSSSRCTRGVNI